LKQNKAHVVYDIGVKLPYSKIDFLKESNGVIIKTGDSSHPTCFEIEYYLPKWAEEMKLTMDIINRTFENLKKPQKVLEDKKVGII